ncbi:hypothetical protein [uncultured Microbacterium sp.]|uniref:hypothetical protein n=1 Tax=uncultured Microbacterium sp. TaxID=191216 RepID=UPI0035CBB0FA
MFWATAPWIGVLFVITGISILLARNRLTRLLVRRLGSLNEPDATSARTQMTWMVRINGLVAVGLGMAAIVLTFTHS